MKLEAHEFIVRGDLRARVVLTEIAEVRVQDEDLCCSIAGEPVLFTLGHAAALRWSNAIAAGPPSLARKLGISAQTRVGFVGLMDDPELERALGVGVRVTETPTLFVVRAVRLADVDAALQTFETSPDGCAALWIVYEKGPHGTVGETALRDAMRARSFVDTKVASVSSTLTAMRFARRSAR